MKPDLHLKGYLKRWFLIPRNRFFNIYLHCFEGSDRDRALHDHPWWSLSFNLKGDLEEIIETPNGDMRRYIVKWWPYLRTPNTMHRMILKSKTAWTLFITGPRVRTWGFRYNGWTDYRTFLEKFPD